MRICYVTTDSLSEGVGKSQVVPLVSGIKRAGHEVVVISMEKFPNPELAEELKGKGINWVELEFGRRGVFSGIFRLVRLVIKIPKADVYHARSDIPALALIIRKKKPILWDVRSLWMEQRAVISGNRVHFKLLNKLWILVEKLISSRSSAINTLAYELQPALMKRLGQIPSLRTVVPTSVSLQKFKFSGELPKDKSLMLSGTFNNFYDKNLTEFVMGTFAERGYLTKWCRPKESLENLLNVKDLEVVEAKHEEMPSQIASSSIGIAICRDDVGISLKGVMPTKVAEFLATGRPVILSKGMGDLDDYIIKYQVGVLVDKQTSKQELVSAVDALLSDPDTPKRCRRLAEEKFSMDRGIETYLATYSAIAPKAS